MHNWCSFAGKRMSGEELHEEARAMAAVARVAEAAEAAAAREVADAEVDVRVGGGVSVLGSREAAATAVQAAARRRAAERRVAEAKARQQAAAGEAAAARASVVVMELVAQEAKGVEATTSAPPPSQPALMRCLAPMCKCLPGN